MMNMKNFTVQTFVEEIQQSPGTLLTQLKDFTERHATHWGLVDQGLIIDLLDDVTITAEDMIEALTSLVEMEEGNQQFVTAVIAMELAAKRKYQAQIINIDAKAIAKETKELMPKTQPLTHGLSKGIESLV